LREFLLSDSIIPHLQRCQAFFLGLWRTDKLSGSVAHKLSGCYMGSRGAIHETFGGVAGGTEDEVWKRAYEGWKEGRLTQEEAAMLLGVCDRTFRRVPDEV